MCRTSLFVVFSVLVLALEVTVSSASDFCFGCSDTSDAKGKDRCQTGTRAMNNLHYIYKTEYSSNSTRFLEAYKSHPDVQDCTQYHQYGMNKCCIEQLERLGTVQSYIRSCCDGRHFSINITYVPRFRFLADNNQSLCAYYENKGLVMCVSMCDGDFCNGPSHAVSTHVISGGLYVASYVLMMYFMFVRR